VSLNTENNKRRSLTKILLFLKKWRNIAAGKCQSNIKQKNN